MERIEAEIADLIREIQRRTGAFTTIATVESITGGRIADKITDIPGSSDYFTGSLVSYSNDIKTGIAGVKSKTLKAHGAVSPETACEMAEGGRVLLKTDICVSTTGIAGPGGATPTKPVGLFYVGLSTKQGVKSWKYLYSGNREEIKRQATCSALLALKAAVIDILCKLEGIELVEKHVVTCFLEHAGRIFILRRSAKVGTYQRSWAGVSGYIETDEVRQAYTEIQEETGLIKKDIKLVAKGAPIEVLDIKLHRKWMVHPFLFHVKDPQKVKIDWEHTESRWIKPDQMRRFNTVPGLETAFATVRP